MHTTRITRITAAITCAFALGLSAPAFADDGTVVARDQVTNVIAAAPQEKPVQAVANIVRGITVTGAKAGAVTVQRKGAKPITKRAKANTAVQFTNLTAGKPYQVFVGGSRIATVTPVVAVGAATNLVVSTTNTEGEVLLRWAHTPNRGEGRVTYLASATSQSAPAVEREVADPKGSALAGLRGNAIYTFTITPMNSAGAGKPTRAIMTKSLDEVMGKRQVSEPIPTPKVAPEPAPRPAPQPAPQPGPQPAPQPATKTIYVCPDGFTEVGDLCEQSRPYTFHTVTTYQNYTYHPEQRIEACSGPDCPGSQYVDFGTDWSGTTCPRGGTMHNGQCLGWTEGTRTVTVQVKDPTPAGWSDNGAQWARDSQEKDAMPAGFTDNGSSWVRTAAKIPKVVPA